MKAIKMFGLAALTALMAMAFLGASSAMAESVTLCKADGSTCSEANTVTHVHETSVGNAKLLTTFGTTECEVLFLGDLTSNVRLASAALLTGSFTYSNCKLGSTECTATEENGPSEIEVLKEGHETSKVTGKGLVHLKCGASLDCSYNGVELVGTGKGPLLSTQANGEVTTSGKVANKEAGGFLCPKESKLDITTTPLSATYITAALGYCVKVEHEGNGLYNDTKCSVDAATKNYVLAVGPDDLKVGTPVCVWPIAGLWELNASKERCGKDAATLTGGKEEMGTIVTVE